MFGADNNIVLGTNLTRMQYAQKKSDEAHRAEQQRQISMARAAQAPADTAGTTNNVYRRLVNQASTTAQEQTAYDLNLARGVAAENMNRAPATFKASSDAALSSAKDFNDYLMERFTSQVGEVMGADWMRQTGADVALSQGNIASTAQHFAQNTMPEFLDNLRGLSNQANQLAAAQMSGVIPSGDSYRALMGAASAANKMGVRGQASGMLAARDLGLLSSQVQQQGMANAGVGSALLTSGYTGAMNILGTPIAASANASNVMKNLLAPNVDPSQLYNANLQVTSNANLLNPGEVLRTAATTRLGNFGDVARTYENVYSIGTSERKYNMDKIAARVANGERNTLSQMW